MCYNLSYLSFGSPNNTNATQQIVIRSTYQVGRKIFFVPDDIIQTYRYNFYNYIFEMNPTTSLDNIDFSAIAADFNKALDTASMKREYRDSLLDFGERAVAAFSNALSLDEPFVLSNQTNIITSSSTSPDSLSPFSSSDEDMDVVEQVPEEDDDPMLVDTPLLMVETPIIKVEASGVKTELSLLMDSSPEFNMCGAPECNTQSIHKNIVNALNVETTQSTYENNNYVVEKVPELAKPNNLQTQSKNLNNNTISKENETKQIKQTKHVFLMEDLSITVTKNDNNPDNVVKSSRSTICSKDNESPRNVKDLDSSNNENQIQAGAGIAQQKPLLYLPLNHLVHPPPQCLC